eukprot:jgi/Mesen1/9299/ME000060S08731
MAKFSVYRHPAIEQALAASSQQPSRSDVAYGAGLLVTSCSGLLALYKWKQHVTAAFELLGLTADVSDVVTLVVQGGLTVMLLASLSALYQAASYRSPSIAQPDLSLPGLRQTVPNPPPPAAGSSSASASSQAKHEPPDGKLALSEYQRVLLGVKPPPGAAEVEREGGVFDEGRGYGGDDQRAQPGDDSPFRKKREGQGREVHPMQAHAQQMMVPLHQTLPGSPGGATQGELLWSRLGPQGRLLHPAGRTSLDSPQSGTGQGSPAGAPFPAYGSSPHQRQTSPSFSPQSYPSSALGLPPGRSPPQAPPPLRGSAKKASELVETQKQLEGFLAQVDADLAAQDLPSAPTYVPSYMTPGTPVLAGGLSVSSPGFASRTYDPTPSPQGVGGASPLSYGLAGGTGTPFGAVGSSQYGRLTPGGVPLGGGALQPALPFGAPGSSPYGASGNYSLGPYMKGGGSFLNSLPQSFYGSFTGGFVTSPYSTSPVRPPGASPSRPLGLGLGLGAGRVSPKRKEGDFPQAMLLEQAEEAFARLGVAPDMNRWRDNMRQWVAHTLLAPLVRKIDASPGQVTKALAALGISVTLGPIGGGPAPALDAGVGGAVFPAPQSGAGYGATAGSGGLAPPAAGVEGGEVGLLQGAPMEVGALLQQLRASLQQVKERLQAAAPQPSMFAAPQSQQQQQQAANQKLLLEEGLNAVTEYERLRAMLRGDWSKGLLPRGRMPVEYAAQRIRALAEGNCVKNYEWAGGGNWSPNASSSSSLLYPSSSSPSPFFSAPSTFSSSHAPLPLPLSFPSSSSFPSFPSSSPSSSTGTGASAKAVQPWTPEVPDDAHLLLYLFAYFLQHPGWSLHVADPQQLLPYPSAVPVGRNPLFVGTLPDRSPEHAVAVLACAPPGASLAPGSCALSASAETPPRLALYWDRKPQICLQGRTALWDALVLLCHRIRVAHAGVVRGVALDSPSLNLLPVIETAL